MNDFNDFGLDLAVIGNGQTAALLEPASRLVWWRYPRFDGDPVFSRLLAEDEEKGFCDVVLDDMVDYSWWWLGRRDEARDLFVDSLRHRNRYGLLAEDIHPETGQLWGIFRKPIQWPGSF